MPQPEPFNGRTQASTVAKHLRDVVGKVPGLAVTEPERTALLRLVRRLRDEVANAPVAVGPSLYRQAIEPVRRLKPIKECPWRCGWRGRSSIGITGHLKVCGDPRANNLDGEPTERMIAAGFSTRSEAEWMAFFDVDRVQRDFNGGVKDFKVGVRSVDGVYHVVEQVSGVKHHIASCDQDWVAVHVAQALLAKGPLERPVRA